MTDPRAITHDELVEALRTLSIPRSHVTDSPSDNHNVQFSYPHTMTAQIYGNIQRRRSASYQAQVTYASEAAARADASKAVLRDWAAGQLEDQFGPAGPIAKKLYPGERLRWGDIVRVTYTGTVKPPTAHEQRQGYLPVAETRTDRISMVPAAPAGTGYSVERLTPAESYEDGEVYRDSSDLLFVYRSKEAHLPWLRINADRSAAYPHTWEVPHRPLRKLT